VIGGISLFFAAKFILFKGKIAAQTDENRAAKKASCGHISNK